MSASAVPPVSKLLKLVGFPNDGRIVLPASDGHVRAGGHVHGRDDGAVVQVAEAAVVVMATGRLVALPR